MKKIVSLLLCFVISILLVSCDFAHIQNNIQTPDSTSDGETDNIVSQLSKNEIAMQMYEAAINDKICVIDELEGEIKLKSLCFASNSTRLDEYKLLTKAVFDIDQDGVNEYIIKSTDNEYIILRYYNGSVYSYCLDNRDCFYNKFNADGTFYWINSPEFIGMECGLCKIVFDGETINTESIYSLRYSDVLTGYEYFIGEETVTEDEYYAYRAENARYETMKFTQFEMTCSYPITAQQAWNFANAYWDNKDGCADGAAGSVYTYRVILIGTPNSDEDYYHVALQVERTLSGSVGEDECLPPREIRIEDQILVSASTGEITGLIYESDGQCVSIEDAMEIAKKHFAANGFGNTETVYSLEHWSNAPVADYYVMVIKFNDLTFGEIWIYKQTGEPKFIYYMTVK